ncbi:ABC transporter substrate-binding protein [Falsibacillus albus]|uniref:ABC transporter substrate-binding protein n=1 Tax=Falsibacillus albus TaxID=2478915 RepID=A0A3L7K9U2_9BACI|nr:ABC transporter substrate-binding protein [Falsibacillus albus]RLQ97412.1 ABC transporter substrate-binding protein [Falsibacillus albus]
MKHLWKKSLALILTSSVVLSACGSSETGSSSNSSGSGKDKTTYKIGVTQIVEHPSLDAAFDGFKAALKENGLNVKYDVQNAQGDSSANTTIAANLVSSNVDMIFANSTPSAQAALSSTKDIPIVFTSVTDPVGAELVKSMDQPGGNITGTVDSHPDAIPDTLKFMKDQLNVKNVGLIYNAGEQNSRAQVDSVKKIMADIGGLKAVEASVATSADVKQAAESLVGKIDAFYIVSDNTVVSAFESVVSVADEQHIPLLASEFDSVKRGAFAAYGFDYFDIGHEAGEMAAKILKGEKKPSELPVQLPQNLKLEINKKAAKDMGIELKPEWDDMAEYIEQ